MSSKLNTQIHGTEENRCVSCDGFTDTGVYVEGTSYFHEGFLKKFARVSSADAESIIEGVTGVPAGSVKRGRHEYLYRVCESCTTAADLPKPDLLMTDVEVERLVQPADGNDPG